MIISYHSRLGSLLFTTACVVTFALLASPVMRPSRGVSRDLSVQSALHPVNPSLPVNVVAGKSLLVESEARVARAAVANPDLAAAVTVGPHELIINGKAAGDTEVTLIAADGSRRELKLHIESAGDMSKKSVLSQRVLSHGVPASYENAMDRVQTALTGEPR